ncbi:MULTISPECIES: GntR family transcriptional regulator [unclassified Brevundimonas]|uniref:GntR family transcriptional regulator n=1 Tax=unclassified Brevundimonas TaxID=2622653 RepID=UPI0025BAF98D|nr:MULTISPECIES: GntR family transcriptional regulator [unclassified Brevundimonas]
MSEEAIWPFPVPLHLDPALPTPLYHQMYLAIRAQIRSGDIPPGSMLPGELHLAKIFNVSRITVKRALSELADDGLLDRQRGRGTVVTSAVPSPVVKGAFDNLVESLTLMGLETQIELLEADTVSAEGAIADQLELEAGTPVQRSIRRRKLQGEPFSYLVNHIPADIAANWSRDDLAGTSMLVLLERAGFKPVDADQWIMAVAAEPAVAAALDVEVGTPLLKVARVMRDASGRVVQLIHSHYRSDRFQYHVTTRERRPLADD